MLEVNIQAAAQSSCNFSLVFTPQKDVECKTISGSTVKSVPQCLTAAVQEELLNSVII